jgi:hypothetical protein
MTHTIPVGAGTVWYFTARGWVTYYHGLVRQCWTFRQALPVSTSQDCIKTRHNSLIYFGFVYDLQHFT